MIGIIDYDAGNIKSVEKALHYLGEETVVSRDPQVLLSADKVILPGVGSFGDAMNNLNKFGLVPVILELTEQIHLKNSRKHAGADIGMTYRRIYEELEQEG